MLQIRLLFPQKNLNGYTCPGPSLEKASIRYQRYKLFSIYRFSKFYSGKAAFDSKMTTFIIKNFLTFEKCGFIAKYRNYMQMQWVCVGCAFGSSSFYVVSEK